MEPDNIPYLLKTLSNTVEGKIADAMKGRDDKSEPGKRAKRESEESPMPRFRSENGMEFMEPDWDELDRKANLIIARYTVISTASNILPFGLDVVAVTATFTKLTTELAGVYQVIVSNKKARQMGWAIATTTGTVLGAAFGASRLAKLIPGGYFFGVLVQAPIVGAVAWAAGDALKGYFKQARKGDEPTLTSLRDAFSRTLHLNLKRTKVKPDATVTKTTTAPAGGATATAAPADPPVTNGSSSVSDVVDKIAGLHELLRGGAITQAEFDKKKTELLASM
ncbi:MAG: DUF697 domain-containing protein [Cytophagales bacterium]|nr:DUF697 domain-containing protein [Armatimonadota bacterium]